MVVVAHHARQQYVDLAPLGRVDQAVQKGVELRGCPAAGQRVRVPDAEERVGTLSLGYERV
jgi:hypothetical protein